MRSAMALTRSRRSASSVAATAATALLGFVVQLADAIAQAAELSAELGLRADTGVELSQLAGDGVDRCDSFGELVETGRGVGVGATGGAGDGLGGSGSELAEAGLHLTETTTVGSAVEPRAELVETGQQAGARAGLDLGGQLIEAGGDGGVGRVADGVDLFGERLHASEQLGVRLGRRCVGRGAGGVGCNGGRGLCLGVVGVGLRGGSVLRDHVELLFQLADPRAQVFAAGPLGRHRGGGGIERGQACLGDRLGVLARFQPVAQVGQLAAQRQELGRIDRGLWLLAEQSHGFLHTRGFTIGLRCSYRTLVEHLGRGCHAIQPARSHRARRRCAHHGAADLAARSCRPFHPRSCADARPQRWQRAEADRLRRRTTGRSRRCLSAPHRSPPQRCVRGRGSGGDHVAQELRCHRRVLAR